MATSKRSSCGDSPWSDSERPFWQAITQVKTRQTTTILKKNSPPRVSHPWAGFFAHAYRRDARRAVVRQSSAVSLIAFRARYSNEIHETSRRHPQTKQNDNAQDERHKTARPASRRCAREVRNRRMWLAEAVTTFGIPIQQAIDRDAAIAGMRACRRRRWGHLLRPIVRRDWQKCRPHPGQRSCP